MTQEPGKRIVSRIKFCWLVVKQTGVRAILILLVLLLALTTLGCVSAIAGWLWFFGWAGIPGAILCVVSAIGLGYLTQIAGDGASKVTDDSVHLEDWLADLPASDSLVRASAEPPQSQKTILLRAATNKQENGPEHLLRATTGQEQQP